MINPFRRRLSDAEEAVLELRDILAEVAPERLDDSRAQGCMGCGRWMSDVINQFGEAYCSWCARRRVRRHQTFTALSGAGQSN